MIEFGMAAAAMVVLALWFVLPPLLRRASAPRQRWPALLVALALPAISGAHYLALGHTASLQSAPQGGQAGPVAAAGPAAGAAIGPAQIEAMVARLAARLKQQPDDADGWRKLARSYETLRRFDAAADAYRHLLALDPDNPDLLVDYAVALGMTMNHSLAGAPLAQIEHALAIAPNHVQALALSGSAALERGDKAYAVAQWRKILVQVPAGSDIARSIAGSIAGAEARQ
jgi:cytochrome c-type biogenesis protein CcmH/NrfG